MSTPWLLFRIICLLQMMGAAFFGFVSLTGFFNSGRIYFVFETIAFLLIAALAVFAINLISSNYPDKPVAGSQKTAFNWLFLLNFLLLAFLFALLFAAYRNIKNYAQLTGMGISSLPLKVWTEPIISVTMLLFQFIILYGLYILRRLLFLNYLEASEFDFEKKKKD